MSEKKEVPAILWEREREVNKLIQVYEGFGYCLFFDNFFSNLPMIKRLLKKKFFPHTQLRSKISK
jgi:hypothetical protein